MPYAATFPLKTVRSVATQSYKLAEQAIKAAADAGYFCYDEMFVCAKALLEDRPDMPMWLAHRFPLIILDEIQDTSNQQAAFLNAVIPRSSRRIVVQRLGDPNQKIFDRDDPVSSAAERFPDPEPARCLGIPNSYRFGPDIATLASPFAVNPVGSNGLRGVGPRVSKKPVKPCRHAIFVFPDDSTVGVLDAYGAYALETLGPDLITDGLVTAIGHIHRDDQDVQPGDQSYPKTVSHYWDRYTVEISRKDHYPRTLVQYFRAAQRLASDCGNIAPGLEKMASGIFELARRMGDIGELKRKVRTHRAVIAALVEDTVSRAAYLAVIHTFLVEKRTFSEAHWDSYKKEIMAIAAALCTGETNMSKESEFLAWPKDDPSLDALGFSLPESPPPNVFRFRNGLGSIDIRLGSIHSVKRQTHLATLLMSTNWHRAHSAIRMMPWLVGNKSNSDGVGKRDVQRLLHTYVAMTRPSCLLCLAVPQTALGDGKGSCEAVATLKDRGWRVAKIIDGNSHWQD